MEPFHISISKILQDTGLLAVTSTYWSSRFGASALTCAGLPQTFFTRFSP